MTKEPRIYNGESTVSSVNGIGKRWITTSQRIKLNHYLIPYTKITKFLKI